MLAVWKEAIADQAKSDSMNTLSQLATDGNNVILLPVEECKGVGSQKAWIADEGSEAKSSSTILTR